MKVFIVFLSLIVWVLPCYSETTTVQSTPSSATSQAQQFDSPQSVIHFYCKQWGEGNFEEMYKSLSQTVQFELSFEDFKRKRIKEMSKVGLPQKCIIEDKLMDTGNKTLWSIRIVFTNNIVAETTIKNWLEKNGKHWKLENGGLINGVTSTPFY